MVCKQTILLVALDEGRIKMKEQKSNRRIVTNKITVALLLILLSFSLIGTTFAAIPAGTLMTNGGFETGSVSPWRMSIGGSGNVATLTTTTDAFAGSRAGKISVTSCNKPSPNGYIAFNSPMLTTTAGKTYKITFTYKATNWFEAFFLSQTPTAQVYNKQVVCSASSAWKTVSFDVGPLPTAAQNWFTLRFNRITTVTIDDISIVLKGSTTATTTTTTQTSASTTTATNTAANLGDVPYDWGQYSVYGRVTFGPDPQICFVDNAVLHNGHSSIRIDPPLASNPTKSREVNSKWIAIKPGDHIVFKCWIKTGTIAGYTFNPNNAATFKGARIGVSYYSSTAFINDICGPHGTLPNPPADTLANWVTWNTAGWVQKTIDFIVPKTVLNRSTGAYQVPCGIIAWMQVWSYPNNSPTTLGSGWFADAELYINP